MRKVIVAIVSFLVAAVCAFAEKPNASPDGTPNIAANRIRFSMTLSNGEPLGVTFREGAIGRMRRNEDDALFGVTAMLSPDQNEVTVTISRIFEKEGKETIVRLGSVELTRGAQPLNLSAASSIDWSRTAASNNVAARPVSPVFETIAFEEVVPAHVARESVGNCAAAAPGNRFTVRGASECSSCCVSCGGFTVCDCAVYMSCGACCCRWCC